MQGPTEDAIRVVIVEDDRETRVDLVEHVERDVRLCVTGAVGTVAEALTLFGEVRADVALIDLGLPDGSGIDLIRLIRKQPRPPEVMVITVFGDERHVLAAIEAGATGYLLKDADATAVADAIASLNDGGSPISPAIARHILKGFRSAEPRARGPVPDHLTPRETEILALVAKGYTSNEIANLLTVSYHTVIAHVKQIYQKLSVHSRSAAVYEARQLGILSDDR